MSAKTVASTRFESSQIVTPNDANFLGKVFGGTILSLLDLAAYATASRFAEHICVTASFDRVDFLQPIEVGEIVTMIGHVTYVGRTSLEVTIDVHAENVLTHEKRQTNTARVTMVAIQDGKPVEVPRLICESRAEKLAFLEGKLRRELRSHHVEEFQRIFEGIKSSSEEDLDKLLSANKIL